MAKKDEAAGHLSYVSTATIKNTPIMSPVSKTQPMRKLLPPSGASSTSAGRKPIQSSAIQAHQIQLNDETLNLEESMFSTLNDISTNINKSAFFNSKNQVHTAVTPDARSQEFLSLQKDYALKSIKRRAAPNK
jgi:hypothetical protein